MSDVRFGRIDGEGAVRRVTIERTLRAPIDRVWAACTEPAVLGGWWPDWAPGGRIDGYEGGRIVLGGGEWIDGTVSIWRPPHRFAFTWKDSPAPNDDWHEPSTASLCSFDLVELGDGSSQLALIQYMPAMSAIGGTAGWHELVGERLPEWLGSGAVTDRPARFDELRALYRSAYPDLEEVTT